MVREKKLLYSRNKEDWHALSSTKVLAVLGSSKKGLDESEVARRRKKYGENVLPRKKAVSRVAILFNQIKSPIIYILLIAGAVSFFVGETINAYVLFAAVFLNTVIGFFQEDKANRSLNKLRSYIEPLALACRNGENKQLPVKELVPGDIVYLEAGNNVPADCRVIEAAELEVNEAALTGETVPSIKQAGAVAPGASLIDRESMAYLGTMVVRGKGVAVVTATGVDSELGKIAQIIREAPEEATPLQARLAKLSNQLGILVAIICLFIFSIGILQERKIIDVFNTAVAIAVAAIPEGLPVAVTVILTIGMQRILKKRSLVRKLIAAETLGSTTVICSDKTGTLTEGKMRLANIILADQEVDLAKGRFEHRDPKLIYYALRIAFHCNDAFYEEGGGLDNWKIIGSPTDQAFLAAAIQAGLNYKKEKERYPRLGELPFDSEHKYMLTLHRMRDKHSIVKTDRVIFAKGAPEIILAKSVWLQTERGARKMSGADRRKFIYELKKLTGQGLRVIALAYQPVGKNEVITNLNQAAVNLIFFGLVTLKDQLRAEAKETIKLCLKAGIRPLIITGDYKLTAQAIAREIGLRAEAENIMEGEELDRIDDAALKETVKRVNLYARTSPHHKLRIVQALRENREVVAMIGDGVNDAPAIKTADIGVALGSGTDVAKETSDMVLLDNNFSVIVAAVEEGRIIFSNLRKVITFLTSDIFSEITLIVGSIVFGLPLALLPAQILWLNMINDSLLNFSLAFEKGEDKLMTDPPLKPGEQILNKEMKLIIFGVGIVRDVFIFSLFFWLYRRGLNLAYLRTLFFAILGGKSLVSLFSLRSLRQPIWRLNHSFNRYLIGAALASLAIMLAAVYWPPLQSILSTVALGAGAWLLVIFIALLNLTMLEFVKYWFIVEKKEEIFPDGRSLEPSLR